MRIKSEEESLSYVVSALRLVSAILGRAELGHSGCLCGWLFMGRCDVKSLGEKHHVVFCPKIVLQ